MNSQLKTLLTTSRNPTALIRTLCNDLATVIRDAVRINRGKLSLDEVAEKAVELGADRVVIVDRGHAAVCVMKFFQVGKSGLVLVPPVIHVSNVRLRREFTNVSRRKPLASIVPSSENADNVRRTAELLSGFLGVPILDPKEGVEGDSTVADLRRDAYGRIVMTFMVEPHHVEVGPRIVVSGLEW